MIFSHCLIVQSIFPSIIFIFSFQVVSDSSMIFHLVAYCETPFLLIIYKHKKVFQMGLNHGFGSGSAWIRFFADPDPDPKRPGSGSVCIFSVAEQNYLFSAPAWLQFFHYFGSGSSFASSP